MRAVIPAAGLGTRFLPATKAQPKEMLPLVDKPAIQYVVEEAVASGIKDIVIVTGRGKRAIEDHFDKSFELEYILKRDGKEEELKEVQRISNLANIHYVRQKEQKGLGDAILCAKEFVGKEAFAVLLGDDITFDSIPCLKQLIDVFGRHSKSVIAVEKLPKEKLHRYAVIKGKKIEKGIYLIEDIVEKPKPGKELSDLTVLGRYVFTPEIFECIEEVETKVKGEILLADGLNLLRKKQEIYAYEFTGKRYDVGNKVDWIGAMVELALERADMKNEVKDYLSKLL